MTKHFYGLKKMWNLYLAYFLTGWEVDKQESQTGTSKEVKNSVHNTETDAIGHKGLLISALWNISRHHQTESMLIN